MKLSERARVMPNSPIRKLVPFADDAKRRGIKVFHLTGILPHYLYPESLGHGNSADPEPVKGDRLGDAPGDFTPVVRRYAQSEIAGLNLNHIEVSCRHLAPTPVGMKVSATTRLRSIERRKMWFDIEVNDEKGKCGEGSHLRIMVTPKGISDKAEQKE